MEWYLKVLRQYADFDGRARRKEFWMFMIINFLIEVLILALGAITESGLLSSLSMLYSLFVFIPNLAVSVRRLHDIGKSGWMYAIILIPLIGLIWLLVLFCQDSMPGENEYGPNPKGVAFL